VLLELDLIEAPLLRRFAGDALGWSGYEILTAIADDNLALGTGVVLDCVTWTKAVREQWRTLAARHHARFRPIEVVCGDRDVHRARVEGRHGGESRKNAWPRVEASFARYEEWQDDRLVLDSTRPLEELVRSAVAYVTAGT
jgi:predicted kinase